MVISWAARLEDVVFGFNLPVATTTAIKRDIFDSGDGPRLAVSAGVTTLWALLVTRGVKYGFLEMGFLGRSATVCHGCSAFGRDQSRSV